MADELTKFVTVSTQRSGSTWFTDLLNSHPEIVSYTELFLVKGRGHPDWGKYRDIYYWKTYQKKLVGFKKYCRPVGVFDYLDNMFLTHPEARAQGFKLMYTQLVKWPETLYYVKRRDLKIVHLVRRNVVDIVLSDMAKSARSIAHAHADADVEQLKLTVNAHELLRQLGKRSREQKMFSALLRRLGLPYMEVVYEDLAASLDQMNDCIAFLGCSQIALESNMRKMNTGTHSDLVENIEEVMEKLNGTRFQHMLRT